MLFTASAKKTNEIQSDLLVVRIFQDTKTDPKVNEIDKALGGVISETIKSGDFSCKAAETLLLVGHKGVNAKRVLLLGLGKKTSFGREQLRKAMAAVAPYIQKFKVKTLTVVLNTVLPVKTSPEQSVETIVESLILSLYRFNEYKKPIQDESVNTLESIDFILNNPSHKSQVLRGAKTGFVVGESVNYTRSLANHPGNVMTPEGLANEAVKLAKQHKLKYTILEKSDMKKLGMGALLGINQGSVLPPKFIILEYKGKKSGQPTVLVGKGITFDTGGISIKPSRKMEEMKFDMCGGAAVLGVMRAAAELKLKKYIVGIVPATENMPSGSAIKPGDVVRALNGKTVQVTNTDAEGRMILADALSYAARYKPEVVIDYATLTGSMVVALGTEYTGAFSNKDALMTRLQKASLVSGENIWPMPLAEEYKEKIKSPVADIDNIGTQEGAGSITAALILQEFVDFPWIHLDIAGTAWTTAPKPTCPIGATGVGVKLTLEFLK